MNNDAIKRISPDACEVTTLDTVVKFLPLENAKIPVWECVGFPTYSSECEKKNKYHRKEMFCMLCAKILCTIREAS